MYKTSTSKAWRKYQNRYRLLGSLCKKCGKKHYPPVKICRKCNSTDLEPYEFKNKAKLVSWSEIHSAPKGFEHYTPYIIAIIELEDNERMTTQIVGIDEKELKYGMDLKTTFRKIFEDGDEGIIHYGLKFTRD